MSISSTAKLCERWKEDTKRHYGPVLYCMWKKIIQTPLFLLLDSAPNQDAFLVGKSNIRNGFTLFYYENRGIGNKEAVF